MKNKDNAVKTAQLYEALDEHNTVQILAKWLLSSHVTRTAHLRRLEIVFKDGGQCTLDARDNKTFKKFMRKLNAGKAGAK